MSEIIDVQTSEQKAEDLKAIGWVSYVLHLIVALGAVIPGAQPGAALLIVALVIDLVKKGDAEGTWQANHFSWRIRTVIWAGVLYIVTAPLWLLFGVWMMAIQYIDYPADNHKLGWNEMLAWLRQKRWQSMSFGGIVYLVLLVPVVNLLMMPAAVAGATLFWVREQGAEAMAQPAVAKS